MVQSCELVFYHSRSFVWIVHYFEVKGYSLQTNDSQRQKSAVEFKLNNPCENCLLRMALGISSLTKGHCPSVTGHRFVLHSLLTPDQHPQLRPTADKPLFPQQMSAPSTKASSHDVNIFNAHYSVGNEHRLKKKNCVTYKKNWI